jgi:hypothetical protein
MVAKFTILKQLYEYKLVRDEYLTWIWYNVISPLKFNLRCTQFQLQFHYKSWSSQVIGNDDLIKDFSKAHGT